MKKLYKSPIKSDLTVGKIVPIYVDYQNQNNLRGFARILEIQEIKNNAYIRKEVGTSKKRENHNIIWKYDRFKVEFVDPLEYDPNIHTEVRLNYRPLKGFVTHVKIAYFHKISSAC